MNRALLAARRRTCAVSFLLAVLLATASLQGCTGAPAQTPGSTSTASAVPTPDSPLTAELNQFRDNYGKQIIEIQLSNTSSAPLTVLAAELASPLFPPGSAWHGAPGGTEIPPGQTKSLPAGLRDPTCPAPEAAPAATAEVHVSFRQGSGTLDRRLPATDPFGVLARNYAELCLAQAAAHVAAIGLAQDLEVAADARTAVVRLTVAPREAAPGTPQRLTIEQIGGTTLLAEPPEAPWPRDVAVEAGGAAAEYRLRIRPARCDPHAVAEDKVGTLLPLLVDVDGRRGTLKIAAGTALKGQIYDFVTAACGAH
jgi:hypothetical protein